LNETGEPTINLAGSRALTTGTSIGPYRILDALGAGGMGEVYRARDTALDRDVAIKILPDSVASDPDRLVRFEREAKTLASLNHPNIAGIYGIERRALIMELVEGEDLSTQIQRGPIPTAEALPVARQIADALEAAHGAGIIHRDLKPANIRVRPDGTVKVLDFGLAKALDPAGAAPAEAMNSPTMLSPAMTAMGVILGTAAYMAPEQAKGRAVDRRVDIWAFGCVLYEMLCGRAPFAGEGVADILAKVIERDPDWTALPAATSPALRRLLRRCLEKNPRRRLADIADARLELEEAAGPGAADAPEPDLKARAMWPRPLVLVAIGVLAAAAAAAAWGLGRASVSRATAAPTGTYVAATLSVSRPDLAALADRFAVAPDGSAIVFVDRDNGGLFLRRRTALDATLIPGAPADAFAPVFSPDGRWIAFSAETSLMKIPVEGGTPVLITETTNDYFINLTWGADDRLRYPALQFDAIRSVSANGGQVDTISFAAGARVNRAEWLPAGRLLVSMVTGTEKQIAVREADGSLRILMAGWDGRLTPTGHLLYARPEGSIWTLVAVPFDADAATLSGDSTTLVRDIAVQYATPAAATAAGDVFYIGGKPRSDRRVVSIDRAGAERDVVLAPGAWVRQRLSPDGQHLALNRWEGARRTIWTLSLATGALTQVTYAEDTFAPIWMPDGKRLLFTHFPISPDRRGTSIWRVLTDGRGDIEPVGAETDAYPGATSSDGSILYYSVYRTDQAQEDISSITISGTGSMPTRLLATPASEESPIPSPDGRWLAYATNASGMMETRVAPLADLAASVQVSTSGGEPIRWNGDSARLYYRDGNAVSVVEVAPAGPLLASRQLAFPLPRDRRGPVDVMPDGAHALLIRGGLMYSDIIILQGALKPR
jgi:eukaryotic-like serine/threonine-protein kinase